MVGPSGLFVLDGYGCYSSLSQLCRWFALAVCYVMSPWVLFAIPLFISPASQYDDKAKVKRSIGVVKQDRQISALDGMKGA